MVPARSHKPNNVGSIPTPATKPELKNMPDQFRIDLDTSDLRFDPNKAYFYQNLCKDIPAFAEFESDYAKADQTKRRIFAWIVLMYDMNTPLRREIKDLYKRKVYAATLCGINPNVLTGKYKDYVEDMLIGKDLKINKLIARYISSFASPEYKQYMFHVTVQDQMLEKSINGITDKNTQFLFDAATDKIKELSSLLYGTGEKNEILEARRALYQQVTYDLSDMRPEAVARAMADSKGLPDEWSPYGEGYVPGDIHFAGDDPAMAKDDEESV